MRRPALSLTTSHLALLLLLLSLSLFVAALLLPVIFAVGHDIIEPIVRRPALIFTTSHLALLPLLLSLSLFVVALLLPVIFFVGHDMSSRLCVGPLAAAAIASVITKRVGSHLEGKQW